MTSLANTTVTGSAEEASLTSASAAATATGSGLNGTNDPNMCHVNKTEDGDFLGNPFCKPTPGQIVLIDKNIEGTILLFHDILSKANSSGDSAMGHLHL